MKKIFNTLILISFFTIQNGLAIDFDTNNYQPPPPVYGHYAIGDLNGDGLDDLYFSGYFYDHFIGIPPRTPGEIEVFSAGVLLNNANGQFIEKIQEIPLSIEGFYNPSNFRTQYSSPGFSIVDLDNDGDNDIINTKGQVMLNNGSAQFSAPVIVDIPESFNPIH